MARVEASVAALPRSERTLTRAVLLLRFLGWAWMLSVAMVTLAAEDSTPDREIPGAFAAEAGKIKQVRLVR